jgi:hypothetical protein
MDWFQINHIVLKYIMKRYKTKGNMRPVEYIWIFNLRAFALSFKRIDTVDFSLNKLAAREYSRLNEHLIPIHNKSNGY